MKDYNLKIGAHVSMNSKNKYLLGAVEETIKYGANSFMIYTGAPQNTMRKPIEDMYVQEALELIKENNLTMENCIIHAPYIINLGNTIKPTTFNFGVDFLKKEIKRADAIGAPYIVLHPGASVGQPKEDALNQIIKGLNLVLSKDQKVKIALETMAGKGSEVCTNFADLKYVIDNIELKELVGVCWDTCHMHDASYDFENNLDSIIEEFENLLGLDKLFCMHINDSKNVLGAGKDRHENIGYGHVGFNSLIKIIYHPKLDGIIKILETPYISIDDKTSVPPYKEEIAMIKNKEFVDNFKDYKEVIKG